MNTELIRKALVNAQGALSGSDEYFHKLIDEALAELSAPPDPDEHLPDDQYLAKKQERFALNPQSDEDPAPVLVVRCYQIDFGNHLRCKIKVTDNGLEVEGVMNGWGDGVPLSEVVVAEVQ
jgi:hypothetical protein